MCNKDARVILWVKSYEITSTVSPTRRDILMEFVCKIEQLYLTFFYYNIFFSDI